MPGRSLDQIVTERLGIQEMLTVRLLFQVEDLAAQVETLQAENADLRQQLNAGPALSLVPQPTEQP